MTKIPEQFMQKAILLARNGEGRTSPNPAVGAVVVRDGEIIGQGYHPAAGQPHAEVFALSDAGSRAEGADLYVTLEPCCHHGRTGPCTDAIIDAGIRRVLVGSHDPNPLVAGKGVRILQDAGILVETGILQDACDELIKPFAKLVTTGLPYVIYKAAMTLDGQTATVGGDSKWISSDESRALVHDLRSKVDAIMVGSTTVVHDDPQLTTRLNEGGRDPVRIILDGSLATSPLATVYRQESHARTVLVTANNWPEDRLLPYRQAGADVIQVETGESGLDLRALMRELGNRGLQSILLEGGGTLASSMLRFGLIDKLMIFLAPKLLGGQGKGLFSGSGVDTIAGAFRLDYTSVRQVGSDVLLEGEVQDVYRPD